MIKVARPKDENVITMRQARKGFRNRPGLNPFSFREWVRQNKLKWLEQKLVPTGKLAKIAGV